RRNRHCGTTYPCHICRFRVAEPRQNRRKSARKGRPVQITRRQVLGAAGTAVVLAALAGAGRWMAVRPVTPVLAADAADIRAPGPLGAQALGKADATVTVIEYASVTCPHCADFYMHQFPTLKTRYIDTGKVRFIFREFPRDPLDMAGFMLAR